MRTDPIIDPPALVQAAVDLQQIAAELDGLLTEIRKGEAFTELAAKVLTDRRYRAGVLFARVRAQFPAERGRGAKGWGDFVRARGVSLDSAARYIEIAEQVKAQPELAIGLSWMDLYRKFDLAGEPPQRALKPQPAVKDAVQHNSLLDPQEERRRALTSSASECWLTTPEIRDLLIAFAGPDGIALDPCSHRLSIISANVRWFGPPDDTDGLAHGWTGRGLVFVNPPYGKALAAWAPKIAAEAKAGAEIIVLVPVATGTEWWDALMEQAQGWCGLGGRLRFLEPVPDWTAREQRRADRRGEAPRPLPAEEFPGLVRTESALFDSALFYFGPRWDRFCEVFGGLGRIYPSGPVASPAPAAQLPAASQDPRTAAGAEPAPPPVNPDPPRRVFRETLFPEDDEAEEEALPPAPLPPAAPARCGHPQGSLRCKGEPGHHPGTPHQASSYVWCCLPGVATDAIDLDHAPSCPLGQRLASDRAEAAAAAGDDGEVARLRARVAELEQQLIAAGEELTRTRPRLATLEALTAEAAQRLDQARGRVAQLEGLTKEAGARGYATAQEETYLWVLRTMGYEDEEIVGDLRAMIEKAIETETLAEDARRENQLLHLRLARVRGEGWVLIEELEMQQGLAFAALDELGQADAGRAAELQQDLDHLKAHAKARVGRAEEELAQARARIAELTKEDRSHDEERATRDEGAPEGRPAGRRVLPGGLPREPDPLRREDGGAGRGMEQERGAGLPAGVARGDGEAAAEVALEDEGLRLGDQVLWRRRRAVIVRLAPLRIWIRPRLDAREGSEARAGCWYDDAFLGDLSPDPGAEDPAVAIRAAIEAFAERGQGAALQEALRAELRRRAGQQELLPAPGATWHIGDRVLAAGSRPWTVIGIDPRGGVHLIRRPQKRGGKADLSSASPEAAVEMVLAAEQDREAAIKEALSFGRVVQEWRAGLVAALGQGQG